MLGTAAKIKQTGTPIWHSKTRAFSTIESGILFRREFLAGYLKKQ
jgi:hypothetical protein